jgi:hypothetical protein
MWKLGAVQSAEKAGRALYDFRVLKIVRRQAHEGTNLIDAVF